MTELTQEEIEEARAKINAAGEQWDEYRRQRREAKFAARQAEHDE